MGADDNYNRHRDDGIIDEVTIKVVPRFKTSGLSGNEWRVNAVVELRRKGSVMYTRGYQGVEDAAAHLPWLLRTWIEMPDSEIPEWPKQIERDHALCHQPGCAAAATVVYKIRQRFSREGYPEKDTGKYGRQLRAFCDRHKTRGNQGLEDSDDNYEPVAR